MVSQTGRAQQDNYIVVVSGLPRSGTSMMMKMLQAGGMEIMTDNLRVADENNPKGYYEFERIKQLDKGDIAWVAEAQGKVIKVISYLLEFLPADFHYKVIFMRREMAEILASQRHMLERDGKPGSSANDAQMATLFNKHLVKVENWLAQQKNIQTLYSSYNETLVSPDETLERLNQFLEGKVSLAGMRQAIDQNLYRERR
jgi:hypothetical protein